jgi:RND family efflux transporter MFP subunit
MISKLLHSKLVWFLAVLALGAGALGYRQYRIATAPPEYETVTVARGDVFQTVEAVGKITAVDDLALHFEVPGTVGQVNVREGDVVEAGAVLAALRLGELNAAVAEAQAAVDQKLAGATEQDKRYYAAAVDAAKATYEQSIIDADAAVAEAASALATAKNNLKLAEGGEASQIVAQAYDGATAELFAAVPKLDDALVQADNILGIDNPPVNDSFEKNLANQNTQKLYTAQSLYTTARISKQSARSAVLALSDSSAHISVDTALAQTRRALDDMGRLLVGVIDVLDASSDTAFDAKKTTVTTARTAIASEYASIVAEQQAIANAKNSLTSYTIAYDKAVQNLDQARANRDSSIAIKKAAYDQAAANLDAKLAPVRAVDIAAARAALDRAIANRNKAVITAPLAGVAAKIHKSVGEQIGVNDVMIDFVSRHYEIEADVPETDVARIAVGQRAEMTIDAFGNDSFAGTVRSIEPVSTVIQDVVYYRVHIQLGDTERPIKPGMTANAVVHTGERHDVLVVPIRALTIRSGGQFFVRILTDGIAAEHDVSVGIRSGDGVAEILSGVSAGQDVVVGVKKK